MQEETARRIAHRSLAGRRDGAGEPLLAHAARVALSVPSPARATAWLHEPAERGLVSAEELIAGGLDASELDALQLLAYAPPESVELYVLRIARARGEAGRIARIVLLADLDDLIAEDPASAAGRLGWARRRIATAHQRRHEVAARARAG